MIYIHNLHTHTIVQTCLCFMRPNSRRPIHQNLKENSCKIHMNARSRKAAPVTQFLYVFSLRAYIFILCIFCSRVLLHIFAYYYLKLCGADFVFGDSSSRIVISCKKRNMYTYERVDAEKFRTGILVDIYAAHADMV